MIVIYAATSNCSGKWQQTVSGNALDRSAIETGPNEK